jgi:acetoin utilization deacetylase AcuC-like enzyme
MILISAGFDGHARDPLANLNLTEADFAWATARPVRGGRAALRRPRRLDSGGRI